MAAFNAEQLNIVLAAQTKDLRQELQKAERRIKGFEAKSKKSLNNTSKHFDLLSVNAAKMTAAFGAAFVAFAARTIDQSTRAAVEIQNLSNVAGVGVEKFQEFAFASRTVGIEQEKLADILKDVNDKFGDYYATGAGPLADFFENIAPKVGLTADAFKGLSSDQALGLYVQKLQEAGVSQSEMTFYMEALASDATALAPLLYNNGQALADMSEKARELGVVMSSDLVSNAATMRTRFNQVMDSMTAKFTTWALTVVSGFDAIFNISEMERMEDLAEKIDKANAERARIAERIRDRSTNPRYDRVDPEKNAEAIAQYTERLNQQSAVVNALTGEYTKLNDNLIARLQLEQTLEDLKTGDTNSGTGGTVSTAKSISDIRSAYDDLVASLDPAIEAQQDFASVSKVVADAVRAGIVVEEEAIDTLDRYAQSIVNASLEASDLAGAMDSIQSSMESAFMGMVDGTMTAQDAFKSMARDIIKELYRVLVVQRLVGSFSADGGGILGGVFNAVGGKASGGPVTAGRPYMVGEHGRELFVPQSAGRVLSVPQTKAAIGGGETIIINQSNTFGDGVSRGEINAMLPRIVETTKAAVFDAQRRSVTGRGY